MPTPYHWPFPNRLFLGTSSPAAIVVIPAKAGIQSFQAFLDPGFRRGDGVSNLISLKLTALGLTPTQTASIKFPNMEHIT